MYEVVNSSLNFNNNSSILKNPKICQKPPKPRFQNMKCMKNERLEAYQEKKILKKFEKSQRKRFGVREIVFGK